MKRTSRMKKYQFLLLDAGPIIKLFELGIWDDFLKHCNVTISQTVASQARCAFTEDGREDIDLSINIKEGSVNIIDLNPSDVKEFYDKHKLPYRRIIHEGEKETLAFLVNSPENWKLCAGEKAVFRVLGLWNKANQGISLEEILKATGLGSALNWDEVTPSSTYWPYTKEFREKWTRKGQVDFAQGQGLL